MMRGKKRDFGDPLCPPSLSLCLTSTTQEQQRAQSPEEVSAKRHTRVAPPRTAHPFLARSEVALGELAVVTRAVRVRLAGCSRGARLRQNKTKTKKKQTPK